MYAFANTGVVVQKKGEGHEKREVERLLFGIILAVFCIGLIAASVRIQLVQSREQSKRQDPVYQYQILLKDHVKHFSQTLLRFAKNYNPNSRDAMEFNRTYADRINSYTRELYDEGITSTNLENIFDQSKKNGITGTLVMQMAEEFMKMSNQLPTVDNTIEN